MSGVAFLKWEHFHLNMRIIFFVVGFQFEIFHSLSLIFIFLHINVPTVTRDRETLGDDDDRCDEI